MSHTYSTPVSSVLEEVLLDHIAQALHRQREELAKSDRWDDVHAILTDLVAGKGWALGDAFDFYDEGRDHTVEVDANLVSFSRYLLTILEADE